jgi:hypothetical protein
MSNDDSSKSDGNRTVTDTNIVMFDPAFPHSWGWQAYEPAFAQLFDRVAYELRAPAPHGEGFHDGQRITHMNYQRIVLMDWWQAQMDQGSLPQRTTELTLKGSLLKETLEQRVVRAMASQDRVEETLEASGQNPNPMERHNATSPEWTPINDDFQHDYERSASSADVCREIPVWRNHIPEPDPNPGVDRVYRATPAINPAPERFAVIDNPSEIDRDR